MFLISKRLAELGKDQQVKSLTEVSIQHRKIIHMHLNILKYVHVIILSYFRQDHKIYEVQMSTIEVLSSS